MKLGRNLLWGTSARALVAGLVLGLVGTVSDVQAGTWSTKPGTTAAASEIDISSSVFPATTCLVIVAVAAGDPNGPITSLTADLSGLPQGNDATFVTNSTNTAGTLIWHPGDAATGVFTVTFTATANGQSASTTQAIDVARLFQALGFFQWAPTLADTGTFTVTFTALASDGETGSLVWPLTVLNQSTITPNHARTDERLSPQAPTRGPIVSIGGSCGGCGGGGETDTVIVNGQFTDSFEFFLNATDPDGGSIVSFTADTTDLPPDNTAGFGANITRAQAGGPYSGVAGVPVEFNGGGSVNPGPFFVWDFGDSKIGDGATPSHVYTSPGTYRVTLVTCDNPALTLLGDCSTTSVVIRDALPARAFVADGHRSTPGTPGSQSLCVQIEPVGGAYDNAQVDMSTIWMYSGVPGSTAHIAARSGKTVVLEDRDRNGVQEISACFGREDLRSLFGSLQDRQSVPVTIVGKVATGGTFSAKLDLTLVETGGQLASSVRPNPLQIAGSISFETWTPGPVKVLLFDLSGRLVRTLLDQSRAASGHHEVPIDARDNRGRSLARGIYFYRVQAADGVATGRLTILE